MDGVLRLGSGILLWAAACSSEPSPRDPKPSHAEQATAPTTSAEGKATEPTAPSKAKPAPGTLADLPLDEWTFVPIEGARCANGTPTGVGVLRSDDSPNLAIQLEGGGACWDAVSCVLAPSATNLEVTYDAKHFGKTGAEEPVVRDPDDSLTLATRIFVPYCTGDLHAGRVVRHYETPEGTQAIHHVGALNLEALLARLHTALTAPPETIWLFGESAGGFGATFNLRRVQEAFPEATVHMLADSAPPLNPARPPDGWHAWRKQWQVQLPEPCPGCDDSFGALIEALASDEHPGRIGLVAFTRDATIAEYLGFDPAGEEAALRRLLATAYDEPDAAYFLIEGDGHTIGNDYTRESAQAGVPLRRWIRGWVEGSPSWGNAP